MKILVKPLDSERVAEIVKRHGSFFTVTRKASSTDFIGSGFLNQDEFIGIMCECHEPAHMYWISVHEATITEVNREQLSYDF